ncbi:bifunctional 3-hydroxydecanoyl-ACP dehydratase/trans-2-decenoyl-ACP isomerase [Bermanella marisrubri]|uniref:3-hydroxydecanoyl-ACP dehydratase n=1 Tax=Bermanella marisrubri TaxID=207949 RepID=Q1MYS4_9GAMM|nr:bifunctional 3-hydroxydecanoyl-ACP dehydratase/trans-2-decenoyl-ACP isomerase [Bermanella marisrubri]EAT11132.1 3-hydroxydecanoyl-ACP dehydratase [Oceanobacter sp. RED65] [Bermanella marisrubri]QIZ83456.1 bifunctional 3-hydroxydecanoyl-ACP dehydratase/trans-2-decenoyl-ACP isomerase [Bermanella marisrubri]
MQERSAVITNKIQDVSVAELLEELSQQGVHIQLPIDELSVIKHIRELNIAGGEQGKGMVIAEMPVEETAWFFKCHFPGDPIMPGCLGIEGMWQSLGAILAAQGHQGKLRALGIGEVKFFGEVRPHAETVSFHIELERLLKNKKMAVAVATGTVKVDGEAIYEAKKLKVGVIFEEE